MPGILKRIAVSQNYDSVTPEFKRGENVHPHVDQQFGYVRFVAPPLDLVVIITEFIGRSVLSFLQLFARGVTAMPRGLDAGSATHL